MTTRRELLLALGALAALPAHSQQQGKVWRIGYFDFGTREVIVNSGRLDAMMQGLREQGFIEGKNLVLMASFAAGNADRLNELAADLVRQKPDLILSTGTPASQALQRATTSIPIVVTLTTDPVVDGFAASLARPGRNLTGMSSGGNETVQKLLEYLTTTAPKITRIAVLNNPKNTNQVAMLASVQAAARQLGKKILPVAASAPNEVEIGFSTMVRERVHGVIILIDAFFSLQREQIAALALRHRLPSIYGFRSYAEAGGLMSYGADTNDNFRRAGLFVDKILLRGAKPGDLPFEQPKRYYLVINGKTAKSLGLTIPQSIVLQADEVIK